MTILVPDDLDAFEAGLDADRLNAILGDLQEQGLTIRLPRYEVRLHQDLIPALRRMGITAAFDAADFSGITGDRSLAIGTVQHEAWVKVDEEGVEAAAATGIGFDTSGGVPNDGEFRVDRPFLFLIRDTMTGVILFMGRVIDPRAAE
jgi:serpin B